LGCIECRACAIDFAEKIRISRRRGHHEIDRSLEQKFERFLQLEILSQPWTEVVIRRKLDQKIQVTPRCIPRPVRRRAEQFQLRDVVLAAQFVQFPAVLFN